MQRKSHTLVSLIALGASLALGAFTTAQAADKKADASGTWTWSRPGRDGGDPVKSTLKLKVEGEKVTGTLTAPGRGGESRDTAIGDGKVSGEDVSFTVTREFDGNKMVTKYSGKLSGDSIKGKIESERDGNTRSRDWEAKREGEKKKE